jgi:Flp pilus assembly pilin Flp
VRRMTNFLQKAWCQEEGQDVAEYAVMLAVILVIAIGTIRLIGSHAGNVFAGVGSAIQ